MSGAGAPAATDENWAARRAPRIPRGCGCGRRPGRPGPDGSWRSAPPALAPPRSRGRRRTAALPTGSVPPPADGPAGPGRRCSRTRPPGVAHALRVGPEWPRRPRTRRGRRHLPGPACAALRQGAAVRAQAMGVRDEELPCAGFRHRAGRVVVHPPGSLPSGPEPSKGADRPWHAAAAHPGLGERAGRVPPTTASSRRARGPMGDHTMGERPDARTSRRRAPRRRHLVPVQPRVGAAAPFRPGWSIIRRSRCSPRRVWLLTVPSGTPVRSAI